MLIVFRKRNPKREHGNEFVYEFTKGRVVWVEDSDHPELGRRQYICTGNGTEVIPIEDFRALTDAEREVARRRGGFYSRTGELANGLHETSGTIEEIVPLPESAIGMTA